ncbi:AAA family ATPase [bacterium]|nr:AAA family ATPase [bacterium]
MLRPSTLDLYYASAGSGKTYALVREYLSMALAFDEQGKGFEKMLAMTFTNKATAEMKDRILSVLEAIAQPDQPHPMLAELLRDTGLSEPELRRRSGLMHRNILHRYGLFSISTLDAFTQRIARQFSNDLGLSYGYEIELDEALLLDRAVDRILEQAGYDVPLTDALLRFAETRFEDETSWNPREELRHASAQLVSEEFLERFDLFADWDFERFSALRKELYAQLEQRKNALARWGTEALEAIRISDLRAQDFSRGMAFGYFDKAARKRAERAKPTLVKQFESGLLYSRNCPPSLSAVHDALFPELLRCFRAMEDLLEDPDDFYFFAGELARKSHAFALLQRISRWAEAEAEARNTVPIGRFNQLIARELTAQPSAYLFERLGERYQALLIDEFQDTSVLQWNNVQPLLDNALSSGGSGLIVGDGKQAIYRFRNGKVEQFLELRERASAGTDPQLHYNALEHNWRSRKTVVDFNNAFFAKMAELLPEPVHQRLYAESKQIPQSQQIGLVELAFIGGDQAEEWRERTTLSVCERIRALLLEGYRPCDIAVLVRKNSDARLLATALRQLPEPIESASDDASGLSESLDCRFALALVELYTAPHLLDPRKIALEFFEQRIPLGEGENTLNRAQSLANTPHAWQWMCRRFSALRDIDPAWPADDVLEHLSRVFQLTENGGAFYLNLLDAARQLPGNRKDLQALLQWWTERSEKTKVPLPEREQAVVISTIHKAKGLEYPVVIYAYVDDKIKVFDRQIWFPLTDPRFQGLPGFFFRASATWAENAHSEALREQIRQKESEEWLDQMNLVYVAMTRAVERLYVYSRSAPERKDQTRRFFQEFVKEVESDPDGVFRWGNPEPPAPREKASEPGVELQGHSYAWRNRMRLGHIHVEKAESEIGREVHAALARLHGIDDWTHLNLQEFDEEVRQHLEHAREAVLQGDFRFFFEQPEGWNEREWVDRDRVIRPDRLVRDAEGTFHILDYKTGKPQPSHEDQMADYRRFLESTGLRLGRTELFYL